MILIFSTENDPSTNDVLYWLMDLGVDFVRVNPSDVWNLTELTINNENTDWIATVNGKSIQLSKIKSVWYRRGLLKLNELDISHLEDQKLKAVLNKEISVIEEFIVKTLRSKPCIGDFKGVLNKLSVLEQAKQVGLKIPASTIVKSKSKLNSTVKLISKPIFEVGTFYNSEKTKRISSYTTTVELDEIQDYFFYSIFQDCIEKDFEIRSFYLDGLFYSSAIFSQNNEKTLVDYRHYDDEHPNRVIPFKLPNEIEEKIKKLFNNLQINNGSIDLIYSKGAYYFLEINPVGQFGMVSYPCNFYLEKLIANLLCL